MSSTLFNTELQRLIRLPNIKVIIIKSHLKTKYRGLGINENKIQLIRNKREKSTKLGKVMVGTLKFQKEDSFRYFGTVVDGRNDRGAGTSYKRHEIDTELI